jgi:hypothetical protein
VTGKLIARSLKLTGMPCLPEGTLSSKTLLLVALLAISGALTGCGDAQFVLLTSIQISPGKFHDRYGADSAVYCEGNLQRRYNQW